MKRHFLYLTYLLYHKWCVFVECLQVGVPLWVAIFHDWTKFLPDEWFPYVRCHYRSDGTRQYEPDESFRMARLLHLNRNKHHWQFWLAMWESGETECLPMPDVFRREMLADWRGAGKSMGKPDILGWYTIDREKIRLHPDTRQWIEEQIGYVRQ